MTRLATLLALLLLFSTQLHASKSLYTQEQLLIAVNSLAKRLPMQVDSVTRITAVVLLKNRSIQYRYTVNKKKIVEMAASQENITVEKFKRLSVSKFGSIDNLLKIWAKTILARQIQISNCTTPDTKKWLGNGVRLVHAIYGDNGAFLHEETIGIDKCS
jgi:hypothetical protein